MVSAAQRVKLTARACPQSGVVALLTGPRTWDPQVADSSPGLAASRSGHGQATYTCVPLSQNSINPLKGKDVNWLHLAIQV